LKRRSVKKMPSIEQMMDPKWQQKSARALLANPNMAKAAAAAKPIVKAPQALQLAGGWSIGPTGALLNPGATMGGEAIASTYRTPGGSLAWITPGGAISAANATYGGGGGAGVGGTPGMPATPGGAYGMAEANAANEARYQQGLSLLTGVRDRGMGLIGQTALSDANAQLVRQNALAQQQAVSQGLATGSYLPNLQRGNVSDYNRAVLAAREAQANWDLGATSNIAGFIERRTDQAQDQALLAQLTAAEAQARASGQQVSPAIAAQKQALVQKIAAGGGGAGQGGAYSQVPQYSAQPISAANASIYQFPMGNGPSATPVDYGYTATPGSPATYQFPSSTPIRTSYDYGITAAPPGDYDPVQAPASQTPAPTPYNLEDAFRAADAALAKWNNDLRIAIQGLQRENPLWTADRLASEAAALVGPPPVVGGGGAREATSAEVSLAMQAILNYG
jgi:hypothetical protein